MDRMELYRDITRRTGGDIYLGVVGPVRTGKSTFIKRFMDMVVVPNMDADEYALERVKDELPQSAGGRTIMTTQPKFVPNEAVELELAEGVRARVRLVDCVGYMVKGAAGHTEDGQPRMVRTPWSDEEMTFEAAAELGTRRVITEHSTIGLAVTTDGSITDIPREDYVQAEERVVNELREQGRPFVVLLNSKEPQSPKCQELREALSNKYGVEVCALDAMNMSAADIQELLEQALMAFPIRSIRISLPGWLTALGPEHWLMSGVIQRVKDIMPELNRMRDCTKLSEALSGLEGFETQAQLRQIRPGSGEADVLLIPEEGMFYRVLSEECGVEILNDAQLISKLKSFVEAKKMYDKLESALVSADARGYGLVAPDMNAIKLEEPELMQQGGRYGVRLKAHSSGLHLLRVDVDAEVAPLVGSREQSEEFLEYLKRTFREDPDGVWDTKIFGKPLCDLVRENMALKAGRLPESVQQRLQEAVQRMVNDGCNNMICLVI